MILLNGKSLTIEAVFDVLYSGAQVGIDPKSLAGVEASANLVSKIVEKNEPVYGINTGFGKLSHITISQDQLRQLQVNLLRSHAAGVGDPHPENVIRAALLYRANSLALGYSGVRPLLIEHLIRYINEGVVPWVPSQGSVGSSGDLAPLSHLALPLIGEGSAWFERNLLMGRDVLSKLGLDPIELAPKEGLALINGTQVSLAVGSVAWLKANRLLKNSIGIAGMTLEAVGGCTNAFDERLSQVHPHEGQREISARLREMVSGSELVNTTDDVQDPYSLRCIPQVLGSCLDSLRFVKRKIEIEMNSATDNPLLFVETGEALSGGNFHGSPLGMAFEQLGLALAEIGGISERRTALLLETPGLPMFLVEESGLNSGLMIAQYTAASLVSENKVLAHPAVVDSIPTSAGKEDYNSLASIAARKALQIAENVEYILAIELLTAAQALSFRAFDKMAVGTKRIYERLRESVSQLTEDRLIHQDIMVIRELIVNDDLTRD
jgi:histidine ammonia-lyase